MKLQMPKGRRKSDLLIQRGSTCWFGGSFGSSRTKWRYLTENLTFAIFFIGIIGVSLGAPLTMPVRALFALGAVVLIPIAIGLRKKNVFGGRDSIAIDSATEIVRLPTHSDVGGEYEMGELTLWVHPLSMSFPDCGEVDPSELQSREWWVSLTGHSNNSRFVIPLYGPGFRPEMQQAARQIESLGEWRGVQFEGP